MQRNPQHQSQRPGLTVLVVDSDLTSRLATSQALAGNGHDVIPVGDAEAATRVLESRPVQVIVTDLRLAGVGGELFALSLKHGWGCVGIVALSGFDTPSTRVRCGYAQIDVFLRKPSATPTLLDRAVRSAATHRMIDGQRRGA